MSKYSATFLIISLIAISTFGFSLMGSMNDGSCAGYPAGDCPIVNNLIAMASHHASMVQGYLLAVFNSIPDFAVTLILILAILFVAVGWRLASFNRASNLDNLFAQSPERTRECHKIKQTLYLWFSLHNKNYLYSNFF